MYSRVPSLVGLDLWQAIHGHQEDETADIELRSITLKRTLSRAVDTNGYTFAFKEQQINDVHFLGRYPDVLQGNYGLRRSEYNKHLIRFHQNDHAMNTLNNDLIKEVLNKKDSSHHREQNWFDWNFPNRGPIEEEVTREELKMFSQKYSNSSLNEKLLPEISTMEPFSYERESASPVSFNKIKCDPSDKCINETSVIFKTPLMEHNPQHKNNMDLLEKGSPPTKNTEQKFLKKDNCCRFCFKNGEVQVYYESHLLKDSAGNVVCPILSKYTCPCCGATGKKAHTIRHCPFNAQFASKLGNNYKVKRRNAAGHITSFRL